MTGYALFDTPLGRCGIAWGEHGVVALALPARCDGATLAHLRAVAGPRVAGPLGAGPAEPPPPVVEAIAAIGRLLGGAGDDLGSIVVDMAGASEFERRVYRHLRTVRPGTTTTYGAIATALGEPGAARAVGRAVGRNPVPIVVPCHRVVAAGGPGGFSAPGGVVTKRRLLALEGVDLVPPTLFE